MSLIDSVSRGLGFSSSNAGGRAAEIREQFNQKGIDFLKEQFGLTEEQLLPFLNLGMGGLERFSDASTVGGFDELIGQITDTDVFGNLVDKRREETLNALSSAGLSRSGVAVDEISQIPVDVALAIENALTSRSGSLGDIGFNTALTLGGQRQNLGSQVARLFQDSGVARSGGVITDAQAQAKTDKNLLNTLSGALRGGIKGGALLDAGGKEGLLKAISAGAFL